MRGVPEAGRFALVGAAATATHLAVGLSLIWVGVPPLAAIRWPSPRFRSEL